MAWEKRWKSSTGNLFLARFQSLRRATWSSPTLSGRGTSGGLGGPWFRPWTHAAGGCAPRVFLSMLETQDTVACGMHVDLRKPRTASNPQPTVQIGLISPTTQGLLWRVALVWRARVAQLPQCPDGPWHRGLDPASWGGAAVGPGRRRRRVSVLFLDTGQPLGDRIADV